MKLGVPGEGPGRGWGTRENDESGDDGGLRRRPGGHAPPYSLFFLVLDLGAPPQPLPLLTLTLLQCPRLGGSLLVSPWSLRAPPPLLPALFSTFPLSSFLPSCLLVSLHTRLLGRAGCGWGGGMFRGGVRSVVSRGLLQWVGRGERTIGQCWGRGGWEWGNTCAAIHTLGPRPRVHHI